MALTGTTKIVTDLSYTDTSNALATPTVAVAQTYSKTWVSTEADIMYKERKEIAATTYSLDVYGGITDDFGTTISLASLRQLIIINRTTTSAHTIKVNGNLFRHGSSPIIDGWVDDLISHVIGAGGVYVISSPEDGYTLGPGSAAAYDTLTLDSGANTVEVDIIIIGKA